MTAMEDLDPNLDIFDAQLRWWTQLSDEMAADMVDLVNSVLKGKPVIIYRARIVAQNHIIHHDVAPILRPAMGELGNQRGAIELACSLASLHLGLGLCLLVHVDGDRHYYVPLIGSRMDVLDAAA